MVVWIVEEGEDYEGEDILGVYARREDAVLYVEALNRADAGHSRKEWARIPYPSSAYDLWRRGIDHRTVTKYEVQERP